MKLYYLQIGLVASSLMMSGCGGTNDTSLHAGQQEEPAPEPVETLPASPSWQDSDLTDDVPEDAEGVDVGTEGQSADAALDQTTPQEREQASQTSDGQSLGRTVASLGDPTQHGLWLRTPLVKAKAKGRIEHDASGASVEVTLIPIEGGASAGSRISLSAMRTLGVPLTDLPTLNVFRR